MEDKKERQIERIRPARHMIDTPIHMQTVIHKELNGVMLPEHTEHVELLREIPAGKVVIIIGRPLRSKVNHSGRASAAPIVGSYVKG